MRGHCREDALIVPYLRVELDEDAVLTKQTLYHSLTPSCVQSRIQGGEGGVIQVLA